jgi:hypothetical protein
LKGREQQLLKQGAEHLLQHEKNKNEDKVLKYEKRATGGFRLPAQRIY